jgi:hypothetical protein
VIFFHLNTHTAPLVVLVEYTIVGHMLSQNLRTASLVLCTLAYLLIGAAIFQAMESGHEKSEKIRLAEEEAIFRFRYNISDEDFQLMTNNIVSSVPYKDDGQWHFSGSFYFVTTVITTIGLTFQA